MPVRWLLGPNGERVEFADAPAYFDRLGVLPSYINKVIADIDDEPPRVRPSSVNPRMNCRRQAVFAATLEYGIDPIAEWPKHTGTAIHKHLETQEIHLPTDGSELPVFGVPMKGTADFIDNGIIEDAKVKGAFFVPKFPTPQEKAQGEKVGVRIWEPDDQNTIDDHAPQLSIYGILARHSGLAATKGRIRRIYPGVKAEYGPFKTLEFQLMSEQEMEAKGIGDWVREYDAALKSGNPADVPADGRKMVGSKGNLWNCDKCTFRQTCDRMDANWSVW